MTRAVEIMLQLTNWRTSYSVSTIKQTLNNQKVDKPLIWPYLDWCKDEFWISRLSESLPSIPGHAHLKVRLDILGSHIDVFGERKL